MKDEELVEVPYEIGKCLVCGKPIMNMVSFPPSQPDSAVCVYKNKEGNVILYGAYGSTTLDGETAHIIDHNFLEKCKKELKEVKEAYICDGCFKEQHGKLYVRDGNDFYTPEMLIEGNSRLASLHPELKQDMLFETYPHKVAAIIYNRVTPEYMIEQLSRIPLFAQDDNYSYVYDSEHDYIDVNYAGQSGMQIGRDEVLVFRSLDEFEVMHETDFFKYYQPSEVK